MAVYKRFIGLGVDCAWTFMEHWSKDFYVLLRNVVVTDPPSFLELTGGDMEFLPVDCRESLKERYERTSSLLSVT